MLENNRIVPAALQPVSPAERVDAIDVLRGIAVLGVLVAYTVWNLGSPPVETYGTFDQVLTFILNALLNTKAYTLLAFLFGLGFSMQLLRARERGENIVPSYSRRLLTLLIIGVAHSLLLRNGDILVPYATVGFALLLFRNASSATLVLGAVLGCALPFVARWVWEISGVPFPARPDTQGMGHLAANFEWAKYWYSTAITLWPEILPMFLCGLYAGRKRIMENIDAHKKVLLRILTAGFVIGITVFAGRLVVISMIEWPASPTNIARVLLRFSWNVHAWGLAAFYGASILLLLQRRSIRKFSRPFAAVGRMSLTNYLLQTVVVVPICIAYDLYDTITPGFGLLLALVIGVAQVITSTIWLQYFRFGPAEWLWRSVSYEKLQPMLLEGMNARRYSCRTTSAG